MPLKEGDFVLIHYTIKVIEGGEERVIDTTREEVAREAGIYREGEIYGEYPVVIGRSRLLEGIEEALREMDVGERREVEIPPEKAYGPRDEKLVVRVPKSRLLKSGIPPRPGEVVEAGGRRGVIVRVTERFAYIDFNHPLAGKKLKVDLEVVRKVESDEEKARLLAKRFFPRLEVEAEVSDGRVVISIPADALGYSDLDSRLRLLLTDVVNFLNPRRVEFVIYAEKPEEAEGQGGEEKQEAAAGAEGAEAKEAGAGGEAGGQAT